MGFLKLAEDAGHVYEQKTVHFMLHFIHKNSPCFTFLCTKTDRYESNYTGDGKTDKQTRTEVRMGKIYKFVQSNVMTPGVTERHTLMIQVSQNIGH